MDYKTSVALARHLGYEEVLDAHAFHGRYFIKNELKWIHDIEGLMRHLRVSNPEDLVAHGYDLANYHSYKHFTNEMAQKEMQSIYDDITHADGEATYMCDGMWLLPDGTIESR